MSAKQVQFKAGQYASCGARVPNYADEAVEDIRLIAPILEKRSGLKVLPKPEVRRSLALNDLVCKSNGHAVALTDAAVETAASNASKKKGNRRHPEE